MKNCLRSLSRSSLVPLIVGMACLTLPYSAHAAEASALVDDFSKADFSSLGAPRFLVTDKTAGGQSSANEQFDHGVLKMSGELIPGRGRPAFVSLTSLLTPDGQPRDVSTYEGVRLRVKVKKGMLVVQVSSTDVDNYDYHSSSPVAQNADDFQEVRIPFKSLKRAWSEQTALNLKDVTGVNLVAVGMAKGDFAYEVDEIDLY